jgi:signal transduction histidine kinase
MSRRGPAILVGTALAGAALTGWLAMVVGMTAMEALKIAVIVGGAAAGTGLLGLLALMSLRRASLGLQALVVALTSIGGVAAGSSVAAAAMFLTAHDLHTLGVIMSASATVGVLLAIGLGLLVGREVRSLRDTARRIGAGDPPPALSATATAELTALARELEEMAERLEEARRREQAIESSRRELVAWISHDLRTPLAAIRAVAEALEDGVVQDPETVARYQRTVRVEADRLAGLVDDLFELSRINAGALRLVTSRVALSDLVSDAVAGASVTARRKRVELAGRSNGDPPVVDVSPPEVARALSNLLENAVRHTPVDGTVLVESGLEDGRAYVSVVDQCGGIPDDDLDRVFEMAFRGQAARTPEPDAGAGLGLAIAKGIAEAHRGELSVRNEGSGCRFTLWLPLEAPDRSGLRPVGPPSA